MFANAKTRERFAFSDRTADDFLAFNRHVSPTIAMLDDGTHFAVIHFQGKPLLMQDESERYAERRRRHSVQRGLSDRDVTIYEHLVCHDRVPDFQPGQFRSAYAANLSNDYHTRTDSGLVARDWFVTIMVRPDVVGRMFLRRKAQAEMDSRLVRMVEERCALLIDALPDYGPRRLGVRYQGRVAFSEIAEAMRLILYCRWAPVPLAAGRLASAIYSERVICRTGRFEIRGAGTSSFGMNFGLLEYIEAAPPNMLDALLAAPGRMVLCNSFRYLTRGKITDSLGLREQQMVNSADRATSLAAGLADALDDVSSGRALMGDHHFGVTIHVDNLPDLAPAASRMNALLTNCGLPVAQESLGNEAAYWAQAPGSPSWIKARHGAISAYNFASFSSLSGEPRGGGTGHWGAPILRLRTATGTVHDFHPHVGDVGHTLLFGPNGTGKTVVLALVAAMLEPALAPHGGVIIILDADGSNELTVRACGGYYTRILRGQASGMAPFKALRNTPEARSWLLEFALGLIMADGGPMPSPTQVERLDKGILFLMRRRPEIRSFAALRQFADHLEGGCGERLARWCRGGSLGWAFDGEEDRIRLDAGIVGIDNSEILTDDAATVRAPMAAYQLFRISEKVGTGVPGAVFVDEAQAYLPDGRFSAGFERFVTRLRKGNGMLWLAMQQPQAILRHGIGQSLVSNALTKILFSNPAAEVDAYRNGLHCTEGELAAVREGMAAMGRGTFLVKRDAGSFIARADLSSMPDHIAILSGNPKRRALAHRIMAELGTESPDAWVPVYRQRHMEANQ